MDHVTIYWQSLHEHLPGGNFMYGVATVSRFIGLFCRIWPFLQGSFAKQIYNCIDPTNQSHPISELIRSCVGIITWMCVYNFFNHSVWLLCMFFELLCMYMYMIYSMNVCIWFFFIIMYDYNVYFCNIWLLCILLCMYMYQIYGLFSTYMLQLTYT